MNWLLPEYIADVLPAESARIERLRRRLLDHYARAGYELVMPPLLEHLDSLLTGSGQDLRLRTFKLVDQLSGRTLGVRADITPQVARIDAHLLNRNSVTRLCYCGSVLHTLPAAMQASREPLQIGAEIYGYAGIAADAECLRLMHDSLQLAGLTQVRLDIGHVGIFRALARAAQLAVEDEDVLLSLLQTKDLPGLTEWAARIPEPYRSALLRLPHLYGGPEILQRADALLPSFPVIIEALDGLKKLQAMLPDLALSFDLADLRGYHYHNGIVFAAYTAGLPGAVASGGRYDGVGAAFGRERPATGFSLDLRELARVSPAQESGAGAISAPWSGGDAGLTAAIASLRAAGEVVVTELPGELPCEGPPCDRKLICQDGQWQVQSIN